MAPYKTDPTDNVTYTTGGQSLSIEFLPTERPGNNGFDRRSYDSCVQLWGTGASGQGLCRELLSNMDQVT